MDIDLRINPSYKWEDKMRKAGISNRELEVVSLAAQGFDNQEIAGILGIKYQSVKNRMYNLMKKLGARTSIQAMAIMIANNLIKVENPEATNLNKKPTAKDILIDIGGRLVGVEGDADLNQKIKTYLTRKGVDFDDNSFI
jgi:DNA-binding CsgD family transcriptional regulator